MSKTAAGRECFHCKQWIADGTVHDCWTTTEAALTRDLPEDLLEAWDRLRETAAEFGEQRIYASHHSIMFSRKACYFFVRPRPKVLELCIFLGRTLRDSRVRKAVPSSRSKVAHLIHIKHRDEVEAPMTDWLREAYEWSPTSGTVASPRAKTAKPKAKPKPRAKPKAKPKPRPRRKPKR
jgi:hypothetical protein